MVFLILCVHERPRCAICGLCHAHGGQERRLADVVELAVAGQKVESEINGRCAIFVP